MTQTTTISPARQAILELIKSNRSNHSSTRSNHSSTSSNHSSTSSNSSSNSNDGNRSNRKKKATFDRPNQRDFKKELDQKRRSAYIVKLGGRMI